MGLNFLKGLSGKTAEDENKPGQYSYKGTEVAELKKQAKNLTNVSFSIQSGKQKVNSGTFAKMFQKADGTIYFGKNYYDEFELINYVWSGPKYQIQTKTTSDRKGTEKKKGKSGKMTAGALVGSMILPGVGTAVGAAIGAGGKGKKNIDERTTTNTVQNQVEIPTPATLTFKNRKTGEVFSIVIHCTTLVDSKIRCFRFSQENSSEGNDKSQDDLVSAIKSLKELLDMGAISQEEYENKKQEILSKL